LSFHRRYLFFDLFVEVRSDSAAFIEDFDALYGRFRDNGPRLPHATYCLSVAEGTLTVENESLVEADRARLFQRALERILDAVAGRVRSHLMIHAGALSWNGHGLVFPAYSFHGKTTLMLELVRRGFCFLSDEIAAFDRASGCLAPFPRSLRIWPSTLALLGLGEIAPNGFEQKTGHEKLVFDIERLLPGSLGDPCRPHWLVVLTDPQADADLIGESERNWHLVLDRMSKSLLERLSTAEGVTDVGLVPEAAEGVIKLRIERGTGAMQRVRAICRDERVAILNEIKGGERMPDFGAIPTLEPIPRTDAAIELVRRFRAGEGSALLEHEHGSSGSRLLLEVTEHLKEMDCYRLRVGRLGAMAGLICELVSENVGHGG
jgi:hypothetical protein